MSKHKHEWHKAVKCVELGEGVCAWPFEGGFFMAFEMAGLPKRVVGTVRTAPTEGRAVWSQTGTLEGGDLTLRPSVDLNYGDGYRRHGFVTDGKWVEV